ncbi:sensor histidine kinase [Haloarcula litorea]|uniref:sensor histidine kinase n=1 Tax=Haloarcula litorea TaxID=3032579 RepID=UPI0023E7A9DB|nr:HAMP domain-containing sensor histidine kinase [Halomicroarcula sp. GDY20]
MDEREGLGPARQIREWWVPTVSLMALGTLTVVVWLQVAVPAYALLDVMLPAAFTGVAVWQGLKLRRTDGFGDRDTVIQWFTGGLVVMACLGLWPVLLRAVGQPTVPVGVRLLTEIIAGGLFGLLVGVYSVQARRSAETAAAARVEQELLERQRETTELLNRTLRHQLLNSLTVVRGRAELLATRTEDDPQEWARTVLDRTDRMAETVENIGELTRTLTGEPDLEPVALPAVVPARVAETRERYPEATVRVESLPDRTVRADDLFGRALASVLENAVEHNDRDRPTVEVSATVTAGTAVVTVADDGPGIPAAARERVLEANERGLQSDGDGLGLFLAASVLRQYGGEIDIREADLGGAAVELSVPLAAETVSVPETPGDPSDASGVDPKTVTLFSLL